MLKTIIFICISWFWFVSALGKGAKRKEPNLSPNIEISENQNWQREFPALFIADNQFHNIYGGSSLFRTWISDSIVNVSIRPPRLDLFAPLLYEWSVRNFTKRKKFIIHLGDATDVSCKNEWNIFVKKMNGLGKKGWVLAPGNHDSTFYGNWAPSTTSKNSTGFGNPRKSAKFKQYAPRCGQQPLDGG